MPFALPAAATAMAAAAPAAAAAASSAALTSTLVSVASQVALNMAVSAVMSALSPQVGAAGRPVDWTLNPDGPIPFAFGRVGVAGSVVHKRTFGPDKMYYGFVSVLSGAGPIAGFNHFFADDLPVTFDGIGKAVSSEWAGEMWRVTSFGAQPSTYLQTPSGLKNNAQIPDWGAGHALSGKACTMLVMGENSKRTAYPNGEVKPLEDILGLYAWDPRQDSTWPGGSGPCRLNDPSTWVWSQNPMICALKWALGLWEGPIGKGAPQVDQQVGGIGSKLSGIDVPALLAAANVADANGWYCGAYPSTDDDKHQVLASFMQAAGATYTQRAGKISCIQRAAPRASVVTITANDVVGALEIDTAASRIDRINTIRPRYWSPEHRWQMTAIDEVTAEAYRSEDGGKRTRGIDYPYVTNATQAAQLAALDIANTREGIAGIVPLKPHLQRIRPGDAFTISEPGFVLDAVKCLCLNTDYDPATGIVSVTFVSETDEKYAFALGQSPVAPTPPVLTPSDPTVSPPTPEEWDVVVRPPAPGGGGYQPGLDLSGIVNNATAYQVLVETAPTADGPWQQAYSGPPTAERITLVLDPNATYYVGVTYLNRALVPSVRTVYGPYTTGPLVSDDAVRWGGRSLADLEETERRVTFLLDRLLSLANDRTQGAIKEARERATHVRDTLDRLRLLADIDPVDGVSIIRGDNLIEGGDLTLAQTFALLQATDGDLTALVGSIQTASTEGDEALAEAIALVAVQAADDLAAADLTLRAYTDGVVFEAVAGLATLVDVDDRIAAASLELESYVDDGLASATADLVTAARLAASLSTAYVDLGAYADYASALATAGLVTAVELEDALAAAGLEFESYVTTQIASATADLVTEAELAEGLAAAALSLESYVDAEIASATADLVTIAQLSDELAGAALSLEAYVDAEIASATADLVTNAQLADGLAGAALSLESYVDDEIAAATAALVTATQLADGLSAAYVDLGAYTDYVVTTATADLVAYAEFDDLAFAAGVTATAVSGLEDQNNLARLDLIAGPVGGAPARLAIISDTYGTAIALDASKIYFGPNTFFEAASYTLRTEIGSIRYVQAWGPTFGSDNLTYWRGPSSVADGAETKLNADAWDDLYGGSYYGGETLAGFFDSGAPSSSLISLDGEWKAVSASAMKISRVDGVFRFWIDLEASGFATPDGEGVATVEYDYRVASVRTDLAEAEVFFSGTAYAPNGGTFVPLQLIPSWDSYALATQGGPRSLFLQARITPGSLTTTASIRNGRVRGSFNG